MNKRGQKKLTSKGRNSVASAKRGQRKLTWGKHYREYMEGKLGLKTYQKVGVGLLVFVFSGMVGWIWEFLLAEAEGGFQHLYIKGGNLLPWMNIYAYGALLIIAVSWKLRKYPWLVALVSAVACGILEGVAGWLVYTIGNGTRYWEYNEGLWAVGSIGGFVCLLSVTIFGVAALMLMYGLLPLCIYWSRRMTRRAFLTLSITLFTIVMVDDLTNLTLKNLNLPTAQDFYRSLGWVYK